MKRDEPSNFQIPSLPKQRATVSQHEVAKPPQEIEDRKGEARSIVKRLLAIIEEHRVSALRMEFTLDARALDTVIRALEAETGNEDTALVLNDADEVRRYLLTALYEDLLDEPSNILFTTHIAKDVVRYEAMEIGFWKECVGALRTELLPDSP